MTGSREKTQWRPISELGEFEREGVWVVTRNGGNGNILYGHDDGWSSPWTYEHISTDTIIASTPNARFFPLSEDDQ